MTDLELKREEIKTALVAAHRSGDWEAARKLSQEKQALKKKRDLRCVVCGAAISPNNISGRCQVHDPHHLCNQSSRWVDNGTISEIKHEPAFPTQKQIDVLRAWIGTGNTKLAADMLGISPKTIEYHLARIRRKIGIVSPVHLAVWAVKHGIA